MPVPVSYMTPRLLTAVGAAGVAGIAIQSLTASCKVLWNAVALFVTERSKAGAAIDITEGVAALVIKSECLREVLRDAAPSFIEASEIAAGVGVAGIAAGVKDEGGLCVIAGNAPFVFIKAVAPGFRRPKGWVAIAGLPRIRRLLQDRPWERSGPAGTYSQAAHSRRLCRDRMPFCRQSLPRHSPEATSWSYGCPP